MVTKDKVPVCCRQCGNVFYVIPFLAKSRKFCSKKCSALFISRTEEGRKQRGRNGGKTVHTEEFKERIRQLGLSNRGKPRKTLEQLYGFKRADEIKKSHADRIKRDKIWLRRKPKEKGYREKALDQLENKCRVCGESAKLDVHHIDGNHNNNDISNLEIYCRKHHHKVHYMLDKNTFSKKYRAWFKRYKDTSTRAADIAFRKQQDYGPHNIGCGGAKGLIVRMNDKITRMTNLIFGEKAPFVTDETLSDTALDLANYALFLVMVLEQKWYNKKEGVNTLKRQVIEGNKETGIFSESELLEFLDIFDENRKHLGCFNG